MGSLVEVEDLEGWNLHPRPKDIRDLWTQALQKPGGRAVFDVELDTIDKGRAESVLKDACEKLLANTVIENYRIEKL